MNRLRCGNTLNTEPCAIAPDAGVIVFPMLIRKVDFRIRRYHHPTRAARAGTPVRARFCNGVRLSRNQL